MRLKFNSLDAIIYNMFGGQMAMHITPKTSPIPTVNFGGGNIMVLGAVFQHTVLAKFMSLTEG